MKKLLALAFSILLLVAFTNSQVLKRDNYKHYIEAFNKSDYELYKLGDFSNDKAWDFLEKNIPIFDCPDKQLEEMYYFR